MGERTRALSEVLGYPADARLLVINADDFGMCHAENAATIAGLEAGAFCSTTLMVPCPWFTEAAAWARRVPAADVGVHVTHTSEWDAYRWGPVSGRAGASTLVDDSGCFHPTTAAVYAHARLDEIESETRAQIERALAAGVDVSHLDSHMGTLQLDVNYHDLYVRLAAEYRLPIRMAGREAMRALGMGEIVAAADRLGVLSPDHFWYGGPPAPDETAAYWTAVLRHLEPGVSEIYIHAGADEAEGHAMTPTWTQRVADFRFFTAPATRKLIRDLGITLVGYRALRDLQRRGSC